MNIVDEGIRTSDAFQLLNAALDSQGYSCVVGLKSSAPAVQKFFAPGDYQGAVDEAMRLSGEGFNAYFGTSTYMSGASRKADNVHGVRLLKLDLDVAANDSRKYTSKHEAVAALLAFCTKVGLPVPVLVDSGYGVHVYWILSSALDADCGKQYGEKLKAICIAHRLKADSSVTGDISRILRVPDTFNYKQAVARKVKLKGGIVVHEFATILDKIDALHADIKGPSSIAVPAPSLQTGSIPAHLRDVKLDDTTRSLIAGRPKSFAAILAKCEAGTGCAQLADIHQNQAAQDEPRWRAGLSIAHFCGDGAGAIHNLSRQHPDYNPYKTEQKAAQITGPFKCATFESNWPERCLGCAHRGRVTSPIQLGDCIPLTDEESMPIDEALVAIREAEERAKAGDCGAPFEPQVIEALQALRKSDAAEYQRMRNAIKKANRNVSLAELDALITNVAGAAESKDRSAADALAALAREQCTLFHDQDDAAYATFQRDGHRECWPLYSESFSKWLSYQFYRSCGIAPAELAMTTALSTLAGQAIFEGEERTVAVRVAKHGSDCYIDLCDDEWQAVRVTSVGWQVVVAPPVPFVRNSAMRPLPKPIEGCNLNDLWQFANIAAEDRELVLAWLVEGYRPDTPYPILELYGEQGSAKSSTQSVLRDLLDPNKANLRAKPKTLDDLFVTARASHLTSLENLSFLQPDWQDGLCALATGAGYGGRQLYTNADECVHEVKRPIMMNGISVVATRQDLMDRTLLLELPHVACRRSEVEVQAEFERAKPGIFGALMTLFSQALAKLPSVQIASSDLPRMADFACLGEAVFRTLGRPDGEFLTKYREKRRHGIAQTIESSPVAVALIAWLDKNPTGFSGPLKQLYTSLAPFRPDGDQWPRSSHAFGDSLRRISPALREIEIEARCLGRRRDGYHWQIKGDISLPA